MGGRCARWRARANLINVVAQNSPAQPIDAGLKPVAEHVDKLQAELDSVREEVNFLRRRDETLNFYMHRLDEELRLAARLQQDFLPKSLPQIGPVHFHTLFRPAGYVSGDLYDVVRLDETHVGFYMADAVGHGMPAALLTMFIKNALVTKEISPDGYRLLDPGETLGRLNSTLVEQNLAHATFATAVYGTVNAQTLLMRFGRAGHPRPLLMRADGSVMDLDADGGLLGIFPNENYATSQVQLLPGDRLFVYSDGIEVAFAGDQSLDTQQWRVELEHRRAMPTEQLLQELSDNLDQETGSLQPKDDLSIIVVEISGA
jgi:sigma-B regulation protein RsbU (phosphoserine phosphatase)